MNQQERGCMALEHTMKEATIYLSPIPSLTYPSSPKKRKEEEET
jgi:hypothetical protein